MHVVQFKPIAGWFQYNGNILRWVLAIFPSMMPKIMSLWWMKRVMMRYEINDCCLGRRELTHLAIATFKKMWILSNIIYRIHFYIFVEGDSHKSPRLVHEKWEGWWDERIYSLGEFRATRKWFWKPKKAQTVMLWIFDTDCQNKYDIGNSSLFHHESQYFSS